MEDVTTTPEAPQVEIIQSQSGGSVIENEPVAEPTVEPEVATPQEETAEETKSFKDADGNEYELNEEGVLVKKEAEQAEATPEETPEASEPEENPEVAQLEQQLIDMHLQSIFGSQEQYREACDWGAKNLPEKELALYNSVVEQGTPDQVAFAMKSLHAMQSLAMGSQAQQPVQPKVQDGQPLNPSDTATYGARPFASRADFRAALSDPRYNLEDSVGEAYREEIDKRLMMSHF